MHCTTIGEVIHARVERGLASVLLDIYHAAYCAGANLPTEAPTDPFIRDLLSTLAGRHRVEILAPRGWLDPPALNDEIPGWLLRQQRQNETPDGWGSDGWPL